ncbi:MAG: YifB family Mg chelatase-like AAA ATPase [Coriobacteriales bacterium]|nr:YifB family Mg chelatase-like AAA ATPase [Coriobacteriales bacterium]
MAQHVGFVQTATILGIVALPVTVQISVGSGLPGFHIIGLPDLAVKEATQRVRQAIKAAGFTIKNALVVVNLAPSDLRKVGSGFDLPIALAYLLATNQISQDVVCDRLCVGELSLDGAVKPVSGQLAYERLAIQNQLGLLTGPTTVGLTSVEPADYLCLENLADLHTNQYLPARQADYDLSSDSRLDYADIAGNDMAKRALQIAAAGNHGLLMIGPPGSGKSMLAHRLPTILSLLDESERLESALIHSVVGLPYQRILAGERPFRAPHHSASRAGLIGGGMPILPGEISLAHNGVLFLDELPEFGSSTLQLLRQPIELGFVALARAAGIVTMPAEFMLVAAANPCPCGYLGDDQHACKCTPAQISRYQDRVGGPLLDRINLVVNVSRSAAADVLATGRGTSSAVLRAGVERAREFARQRTQEFVSRQSSGSAHQRTPEFACQQDHDSYLDSEVAPVKRNSEEADLLAACQLTVKEKAFLEMVADRYALSGRGIISTLAVARTIADLDEQEKVLQEHLIEAIGYRPRGDQ